MSVDAHAQTKKTFRVVANGSLPQILDEVALASGTPVVYSAAQMPSEARSVDASGTVEEIIAQVLYGSGLTYDTRNDGFIIYRLKNEEMVTLKGEVIDSETREKLVGAHIWCKNTGLGTSTDSEGHFELTLPRTQQEVHASYLGYVTAAIPVQRLEGQSVVISLPRSIQLEEVVIYTSRYLADGMGAGDVNEILPGNDPHLLGVGGVFDLQQAATKLPGVTTGTDGVGGLNVRGGSYDQNLVLLDGTPIYSPTHAIGIVSVVNPHILNKAALYKGAYSAEYAGRLSSVLDVATTDGSLEDWSMTGSIGPLSVDAVVDGPIVPGKLSVVVAARAFLPTAYLRTLSERSKDENNLDGRTSYSFHDFSARLRYKASSQDQFDINIYMSRDEYDDLTSQLDIQPDIRLYEEYDKRLKWGNLATSARWRRQLGPKGSTSLSLIYSKYELQSLDLRSFSETTFDPKIRLTGFNNLEFKSEIEDLTLKWDYLFQPRKDLVVSLGAQGVYHTLMPKSVGFTDALTLEQFEVDEATLDDALFADLAQRALETGMYVEGDWAITPSLLARVGLHLSSFTGESGTYINPQPRFRLTYRPAEFVSIELNAGTTVQYLHLLTTNGIGLPTDLWVASTKDVMPQRAEQVSFSTAWSLPGNLSLGWSLFYKKMQNLTMFEEGASFLLDEGVVESSIVDAANWENKVIQGEGTAYGSEWSLRAPISKGELVVNYTLSRSERQFDEINFGNPFPYKFDRTHNLQLSGTWDISKVISASASWYYGSGTPITLTQGRYLYQDGGRGLLPANIEILEFGERNAYRLPSYHRLDIGMTASWERPKVTHAVNINLYNVYNRKNILHVALVEDDNANTFTYQQYTVFPFIPSISYKISL